MTILRNVFLSEIRRVTRRREAALEYDDAKFAEAGAQDYVADLAAVQRAFNRLSEEHREVPLLVALEDLNYREAASVLGVPIGTVCSRLSRARTAMRELMLYSMRDDRGLSPHSTA